MTGKYIKVAKVHPTVLESTVPIAHDAFDCQTSIVELHAERVQNQAKIHWEVGEGGLVVYLIGMSAFVDRHVLAERRVQLHVDAADQHVDEVKGC